MSRADPAPETPDPGLVQPPEDRALRETAAGLAAAGGGTVSAILLYGSHLQDSAPTRWSAYDFFVVTDGYGRFYRSLRAQGSRGRPCWLLTALAHVLPPNVISFRSGLANTPVSKCAVFSAKHFRKGLERGAWDHFLKGRVVQKLALLWARSPQDEAWVTALVHGARADAARWVRPFLASPFTVERFAETMLRTSYGAEIRPEHKDRVLQVIDAQRETLVEISRLTLRAARERGEVEEAAGSFRWTNPPGPGVRLCRSAYFFLSKVRATARWFKYIFTFEGWIDYVQRKVERRAGVEVEVRGRERRWPLLFLWPKFFRVLRLLRQGDASNETENDQTVNPGAEGSSE